MLLFLGVYVLRILDKSIFDVAASIDKLLWDLEFPLKFLFCDCDDFREDDVLDFLVLPLVLWEVDVLVYPPEGLP